MQPMWLCIFWGRPFEETFENAQWRKVKQMQPVWLCLCVCMQFEDTFEKAQWRKVKQMHPMWLHLFSCRRFEVTFENALWRKIKQMQPVSLCLLLPKFFEETYEEAQTNVEMRKSQFFIVGNKPWDGQGGKTFGWENYVSGGGLGYWYWINQQFCDQSTCQHDQCWWCWQQIWMIKIRRVKL